MTLEAVFKEEEALMADFGVLTRGEQGDKCDKGDKGDTGEVSLAFAEATYAKKTKAESLEKRIVNLEQGITPSPFVTDDTMAYQKDVPSNALPYAEVEKVGGMTRKTKNLLNIASALPNNKEKLTIDGDNIVFTDFGSIDYGCYWENVPLEVGKTYTFSVKSVSHTGKNWGWRVKLADGTYTTLTKSTTFTLTLDQAVIYVMFYPAMADMTTTQDVTVEQPMIREGSSVTAYEPYYDGLRSASVTEVESVGANLIPYPFAETTKTPNGITFTDNGDGTITANGTATANAIFAIFTTSQYFILPKGDYVVSGGLDANTFIQLKNVDTDTDIAYTYENGGKFTLTKETKVRGSLYIRSGATVNNFVFKPMINKGTTALPYTPYTKNTLPIPTEVQSLDGYGWGINESVYNYIDFEKKQFVKRVGVVDMGTLDWTFESGNSRFIALVENLASITTRGDNVLSSKFITDTSAEVGDNWKGFSNLSKVFVYTTEYFSAISFKADLSGVMLYYELAEPIITDISNILSEDNLIGVEGNGTITFVNEYKFAVPSEITYQIKEVAV